MRRQSPRWPRRSSFSPESQTARQAPGRLSGRLREKRGRYAKAELPSFRPWRARRRRRRVSSLGPDRPYSTQEYSRSPAVSAFSFRGREPARPPRVLRPLFGPSYHCSRCAALVNRRPRSSSQGDWAATWPARAYGRHQSYRRQTSPSLTPMIRRAGSNPVSSRYAVKTHCAFPARRGERPPAATHRFGRPSIFQLRSDQELSPPSADNGNGMKANLSLSCVQLASI